MNIKTATFDLSTTNLIIRDGSAAAASGKIVISGTDKHIKVGTGISIDGDGDSDAGSITVGSNVTLNGNSDSVISGFTIGASQLHTGTKSTLASNAAGVYVGTDLSLIHI